MEYNKRILIVDDNESIHNDFRKVLIHEINEDHADLDELEAELFGDESKEAVIEGESVVYEVDSAFQGQEALKMVDDANAEGRPYALIFMDVRMPPGWDGIETIGRIWVKHPYLEMVLCTAYSDYTWDDIIEKLGCTDKLLFLRKPFDSVAVQQMALSLIKKFNLGSQARYYVNNLEQEVQQRTLQLQDLLHEMESKNAQLSSSNDELKHAALHDSLTTLPNRILFHDRLEQAIKHSKRNNAKFGVALLDLNNFKEINDTQGHLVGDQVLKTISERVTSILRSSDTVARLGGDEFAFVLPTVDRESPEIVAQKILDAISEPMKIEKITINTGGSIGVALYPDHGTDNDTIVGKADTAMYVAKRNGGGMATYEDKFETDDSSGT